MGLITPDKKNYTIDEAFSVYGTYMQAKDTIRMILQVFFWSSLAFVAGATVERVWNFWGLIGEIIRRVIGV